MYIWGVPPPDLVREGFPPGLSLMIHLGGVSELAVTTGNDLLVKGVSERVVAPLSYYLMDLACPAEAAQEPFLSGPAGAVHKGGAPPPELVKTLHLLRSYLSEAFLNARSLPPQTLYGGVPEHVVAPPSYSGPSLP